MKYINNNGKVCPILSDKLSGISGPKKGTTVLEKFIKCLQVCLSQQKDNLKLCSWIQGRAGE